MAKTGSRALYRYGPSGLKLAGESCEKDGPGDYVLVRHDFFGLSLLRITVLRDVDVMSRFSADRLFRSPLVME